MLTNYARVLEMEGIYNLRDVGGYPTADGRITRWRQILRSDSLHALTPASQEAILGIGLRTIIDLRRQEEVAAEPDVIAALPQIKYHNLPVLQAAISSPNANEMLKLVSLDAVYKTMLDHFQPQFNQIFQTIADAEEGPVLVHCSAGKDRTGVVMALLLDLVNVPQSTIVEDYVMTKELLVPLLPAFRQKAIAAGLDLTRHEKMLECQAEAMEITLDYLRSEHGGADAYLQKIGLSQAQIARLRERLVDDQFGDQPDIQIDDETVMSDDQMNPQGS